MKHQKIGIFLVILICVPAIFLLMSGSEPMYDGLMVDAHEHVGVWSSVEDLISQMDAANIEKVVLFGGPEVLSAHQTYPDRIIPFMQFDYYYPGYTAENSETVELVREGLENGFVGVGEILLRWGPQYRNIQADNPVMLQIADVAAEYGVPLNIHQSSTYLSEFENLLNHNENTIIIWAHCGKAEPSVIREMLENHKNLYADLSSLTPTFLSQSSRPVLTLNGEIDPDWKALLEDYPDRFMFGGDKQTWGASSFLKEETGYFRRVLGQLDREVAENIAYKNMLRLLS